MSRRLAVDSIAAQIARNMGPELEYDIPKGLEGLTTQEQHAWNDYISAKSSWKASELRTLYRLVKIETEYQEKRNETKGLESSDPLFKEVREVQKSLHSEMRLLGFVIPSGSYGSQQSEGKAAKPSSRGKKKADVTMLK
jgi:hypothetical protein